MKKHICVVTPDYPSQGRPVYTFVEQICLAFAKAGHQVTIIAPQNLLRICIRKVNKLPLKRIYNTNSCDLIIYSPLDVTAYKVPILGRYVNSLSSLYLRWFIRKQGIYPDIYYCHFWRSALRIYREAQRNKTPLYVASGESVIFHSNSTSEVKQLRNYLNGVICVSSKNKTESIKMGLAYENSCVVIPNAVDVAIFKKMNKKELRQRYGFKDDIYIIAFVGYFNERKGVKRVSAAISKLCDKTIKSLFIGINQSGPAFDPDCEGILFKGQMDHNDIPMYLNCADVFVLPTLHEGCSNAIVEAMACGLPIISSDRDFNADILDKTNSILVDPNNIDDIAKAIRLLQIDVELRERLSQGALRKAASLSLDARVEKILDFMTK